MKKIVSVLLFMIVSCACFSQRTQIVDSLRNEFKITKQDTSKVLIMSDLSFMLGFFQPDSGLVYAKKSLDLANQINYFRGQARALNAMGFCYTALGDLPNSLNAQFQGLQIAEEKHYIHESALCLLEIGRNYSDFDLLKGINYIKKAKLLNEADRNAQGYEFLRNRIDLNLGIYYNMMNQLDSAFVYLESTYNRTLTSAFFHPPLLLFFGELLYKSGNQADGIDYIHQSIKINKQNKDHLTAADACRILAEIYSDLNFQDSAIYYAKMGLMEAQAIDYKDEILRTSNLLTTLYESIDVNKAYQYLKIAYATNEEIRGPEKIKELQKQVSEEQERQRKIEAENLAYKNHLRMNAFLGSTFTLLIITFFLYRNSRQKQKSKQKIERAYDQLKSTQSQLIQSEKMASLGELTAGIAHEIQNPLNFVNNFSELNRELLLEMKEAYMKGDKKEFEMLTRDILENEKKIIFHGQRADEIVKSMLQHSRLSSGKKENTDINALCDEYLRLAYHGMRAKDKSFNAEYKLELDPALPKINVIPQDIGRVLLNLINNAFYAVSEAQKKSAKETAVTSKALQGQSKSATEDRKYKPEVDIATRKLESDIEIHVIDNGSGIPEQIRDKIFQPFFTTKPTGHGTGLGLSLSYDIITKGHNGEIKVKSKEGEGLSGRQSGTEFVIQLPIV